MSALRALNLPILSAHPGWHRSTQSDGCAWIVASTSSNASGESGQSRSHSGCPRTSDLLLGRISTRLPDPLAGQVTRGDFALYRRHSAVLEGRNRLAIDLAAFRACESPNGAPRNAVTILFRAIRDKQFSFGMI